MISMRTALFVLLISVAAGLSAADSGTDAELAAKLLAFTGGKRVKIAWESRGPPNQLMAFDTQDARRRVLATPKKNNTPAILRDGSAVVYNVDGDMGPKRVGCNIIDWASGQDRPLLRGKVSYLMDVWRDEQAGVDWVYASDSFCVNTDEAGADIQAAYRGTEIRRFRVDKPEVGELVYNAGPVGPWLNLSADGKMAFGSFPWPRQGYLNLETKKVTLVGEGCDSSMAPDNSYHAFHCIGNHTTVAFYDGSAARKVQANPKAGVGPTREITVNHMTPGERPEVLFTRWSTHPRYFTLKDREEDDGCLWIGRFDTSFTKVEAWIRITSKRSEPCGWAHAWIQP